MSLRCSSLHVLIYAQRLRSEAPCIWPRSLPNYSPYVGCLAAVDRAAATPHVFREFFFKKSDSVDKPAILRSEYDVVPSNRVREELLFLPRRDQDLRVFQNQR